MKYKFGLLLIVLCLSFLVGCDQTIKIDTTKETNHVQDQNDDLEQIEYDSFDNLYSFQIKIDNEILRAPFTYQSLIKKGWKPREQLNKKIESQTLLHDISFEKDEFTLFVDMQNDLNHSIKLDQAKISSITYHYDEQSSKIVQLPQGIVIGQSTKTDIEEAYGLANDVLDHDDNDYIVMTYEYDIDKDIYLMINKETEIIESVQLFYIDTTHRQFEK